MCVHRVRFYLACLVLVAMVFVWPEMALACWPVMFFIPGCACCQSCTIFSDDFSTDRTGTDYTVVSGSWSVSGGKLSTSSSGALITCNTSGTTGHGATASSLRVTSSGGAGRVIGSYVDSSNYLFCEATINGGSSTFKLWSKSSGSDTQIDTTYSFTGSTSSTYGLCLTWDGSLAVATIYENAVAQAILRGAYTGTGNKTGMGASPGAGSAEFDDFRFMKIQADDSLCTSGCDAPGCGCNSIFAGEIDVTITGVVDSTCTTCDERVNGLYTLDVPAAYPVGVDFNYCTWGRSTAAGANNCNEIPQLVEFYVYRDVADYYMLVSLTINGSIAGGVHSYRLNITSEQPIDCANISETIARTSVSGTSVCDTSSSTAAVASV